MSLITEHDVLDQKLRAQAKSWKSRAENTLILLNTAKDTIARLRALNARLVEDAERLAFWAREFYARHELEDNNTDMEIVADVSSHRALMAEINEPNCTMEDK